MPESTTAPRAVFLSYAREDADAVRRIADALRAFGVEVWFDQNELRGGDSWDQKIRTQIRACTLCIPVISVATQSRGEGYFRREWKIAVERTHDMATGVPFLLPVVIDDTAESTALVPEEFMRVQWTRLAHGVPTPQFVDQVRKLLENPGKPVGSSAQTRPPLHPLSPLEAGRPRPADVGRRVPAAAGIAVAAAILVAGGFLWWRQSAPAPEAGAGTRPPALSSSNGPTSEKIAAPPISIPVAPKLTDKSIAVLPFTNMSDEKDSAYFTDGIQEDILTNLALIREMRVVSRTSVMSYRGTTKPMRQIAQELGVTYILEGSVRRAGNKVRVSGQLIHAATDEHVWAQTYDRDLTDVFAIQSELSQQIAAALKTALSPEEKKLIESRPTENLAAYDAYTKARQILASGSQIGFANLEPLLKTAVLLDPKFAQAWAELSSVYARRYFDYWDHTPRVLANAKAAIDTAMGLAPEDPTVIQKLGDYYYYGLRDYTRAAQQYQRLAERYPNSAPAIASLAFIHRRQGRWGEALGELRRAVQLEPRNLRYSSALAETLTDLRRYDEAEVLQREILAQAPDAPRQIFAQGLIPFLARGSLREIEAKLAEFGADPKNARMVAFSRFLLARLTGDVEAVLSVLRQQREKNKAGDPEWKDEVDYAENLWWHGDKAEARALVEKVLARGQAEAESKPAPKVWVALSAAYLVLGDKAEAMRCAQAAKDLVTESADATEGVAYSKNYVAILACFGEKDQALAELTRLLRTPGGENVHQLRHALFVRFLQGDPRFEALLNDPKNNAPLF